MASIIEARPNGPGPRRRHSSRVQAFSDDPALLDRLDTLVVSDNDASVLVEAACRDLGIPVPVLRFHARRSVYTGATERPRSVWVAQLGEREVATREANGWGAVGEVGTIRLGRSTTVMTIAHELGHHMVFHRDLPGTPAHGKVWVWRFDEAARALSRFLVD